MDFAEEEIFCQKDFMSQAFDAFNDLRRKEELVDFKIVLENRSVVAHRIVLAARIPHFRQVFCSSQNEVTLNEVEPDSLESVIDFAYSGKIKITPENVVALLSATKVLQLTRVYDACWEYLGTRIHSNNVLEMRRLAEDHGCSKFLEATDSYIRQKFEEFSNSESFLAFPFQSLKEVISRDDIKVSTEEKVFEAVVRWVKASLSGRKDLLPELLSSVRMYFLTPDYLVERVSTEELVRSSLLCRDLVEEAKSYHLLPDKRSKFRGLPSQTRLYDMKSLPLQPEPGHSKQYPSPPDRNTARTLMHAAYQEYGIFHVKLFDPEKEKWLNVSSYESRGEMQTAVSLDGMIYVFDASSVHAFNVNTCKWNSSDCEHSVWASGNVSYSGKIYFFGGVESSNIVRCFDPLKQKILHVGTMPSPLQYPGVALVNSSTEASLETPMYVTGGYFDGRVYKSVQRYYPETNRWATVSSMLSARYSHGCCAVNEKIYVCGGVGPLTEVYEPLTNQWKVVAPMKQAIFGLSVTSDGDKLYVCGKCHPHSIHCWNVEIYDPENDEWKSGPRIPGANSTCKIFVVSCSGASLLL